MRSITPESPELPSAQAPPLRAARGRWTDAVALVTLVALSLLVGFVREFSGDLHGHLAQGAWMLDHHQILRTDVFSYSAFGAPERADAWLGEVLLAGSYRALGYPGCYLLRGAALAVTFGLLAREMTRIGLRALTSAALLSVVLAELVFRFYVRPETLTLPILAALLALLGEHERSGRRVFLLATLPLITLWANVHASVLLALTLVGAYGLELAARGLLGSGGERREKVALGLGLPLAALVASTLSASGLRAPLMLVTVLGDDTTYQGGVEWSPLSTETLSIAFPATIASMLALVLFAGRRGSAWRTVYVLGLFALALRCGAFVKVLLVAGGPLVAFDLVVVQQALASLGRAALWRRVGDGLVAIAGVGAMALLFGDRKLHAEVGLGLSPGAFPETACRFARQAPLRGRMFNSVSLGGYLLYCLPEHRVLIDERGPDLYTAAFVKAYYGAQQSPAALRAYADGLDVAWTFVAPSDPVALEMGRDPATWALYYFSDEAYVFVRRDRPENEALVRGSFRRLDPTRAWRAVFLEGAALEEASVELGRQEERCRDCQATHVLAAALALADHDDGRFARELPFVPRGMSPDWALLSAMRALIAHDEPHATGWFSFFANFVQLPERSMIEAEARAWAGDFDAAERLLARVPALPATRQGLELARGYVGRARARRASLPAAVE